MGRKFDPDFRDRMARAQHVDEFHPRELDVVASAVNGQVATTV